MEAAEKGAAIFDKICTTCHRTVARLAGPALAGVTERHLPEGIMKMISIPM